MDSGVSGGIMQEFKRTYIMLSFESAEEYTGTYIKYGNISTFKSRSNYDGIGIRTKMLSDSGV